MALRISRALQTRMLDEAARAPEVEVCGLLFGNSREAITEIQSCKNVAAHPADSFEIDPVALIAAHKSERGGGPSLIGFYHSHPNGSGRPSFRDGEAAWGNDRIWLIVSRNRISAWRNIGPHCFESVPIESVD